MKILKKYLAIILILITSAANAMHDTKLDQDSTSQFDVNSWLAQDPDNTNRLQIDRDWDKLLKQALSAEKHSTSKRVISGIKIETLKILLTMALIFAAKSAHANGNDSLASVAAVIAPMPLGITDLGIRAFENDSQFLTSLQRLVLYAQAINHIDGMSFNPDLTPGMRYAITKKFADEDSKLLRDKFAQEKDTLGIKSGSILVNIIDFVLPALAFLAATDLSRETRDTVFTMCAAMMCLQCMLLHEDLFNSTDSKVEKMLQKIESAFNVSVDETIKTKNI